MNFLILTEAADVHAFTVAKVLESWGHTVQRVLMADLPTLSSFTLEMSDTATMPVVQTRHQSGDEILVQPDLVWVRRLSSPWVGDMCDPRDVNFVLGEVRHFIPNVLYALGDKPVWINPYFGRSRADCKGVQLAQARGVGLTVPPTLISNDPSRIREFIAKNAPNEVVYKGFTPDRWAQDGKLKALFLTATVTEELLPPDDILRLTPGIFQLRVAKVYEVRATFFDGCCLAARLDSQSHRLGAVDWRAIPSSELKLEAIDLPDVVHRRCVALMKELNIRFGCFDFIVDKDGDWVFLEINEMGQFLWVEAIDPSIKMLSTFCEFLESAAAGEIFSGANRDVSFQDVCAKFDAEETLALEHHMHRYHLTPALEY
ncbi:MAG: hypothetical protein WDN03_13285 [Rhizomicrobium sp.]